MNARRKPLALARLGYVGVLSMWAGFFAWYRGLAIVVPTMLCFAFTSNFLYASMGSLLRNWLRGPEGTGTRLRRFNRTMALVLVATALWMAAL